MEDGTPRQSISIESMDTWHRYERDRARYEEELVVYEVEKAAYEEKAADHAHIDFTHLDFLPEIRQLSYYLSKDGDLKKELRKNDPRRLRMQALLRKWALGATGGGFKTVDNAAMEQDDEDLDAGSLRVPTRSV